MPEILNPGGEAPVINAQMLGEAVMRMDANLERMADAMDELADFFEAADRVLSKDEFQQDFKPSPQRITPQRIIDAYSEARGDMEEEQEENDAVPQGPAP
jgi:hypothetical protein